MSINILNPRPWEECLTSSLACRAQIWGYVPRHPARTICVPRWNNVSHIWQRHNIEWITESGSTQWVTEIWLGWLCTLLHKYDHCVSRIHAIQFFYELLLRVIVSHLSKYSVVVIYRSHWSSVTTWEKSHINRLDGTKSSLWSITSPSYCRCQWSNSNIDTRYNTSVTASEPDRRFSEGELHRQHCVEAVTVSGI